MLLSVLSGVLLYYLICHVQTTLRSGTYISFSRVSIDVLGIFLSQSILSIPWLSAGRVSRTCVCVSLYRIYSILHIPRVEA